MGGLRKGVLKPRDYLPNWKNLALSGLGNYFLNLRKRFNWKWLSLPKNVF